MARTIQIEAPNEGFVEHFVMASPIYDPKACGRPTDLGKTPRHWLLASHEGRGLAPFDWP